MLTSKLTHLLPDQTAAAQHTGRQPIVLPHKLHRTRCRAADRPGEHDAAKGIQHDEHAPTAAAAAAAAGHGPSADSNKPEAARVSEDTIETDCEAAAGKQQPAAGAAVDSEEDVDEEEVCNGSFKKDQQVGRAPATARRQEDSSATNREAFLPPSIQPVISSAAVTDT